MLFGDGNSLTSEFVDLASFGLFDTLILTSDLDSAGLGYDNFSFEAVVPLPAALWLFGSGLLALFGFRAKTG